MPGAYKVISMVKTISKKLKSCIFKIAAKFRFRFRRKYARVQGTQPTVYELIQDPNVNESKSQNSCAGSDGKVPESSSKVSIENDILQSSFKQTSIPQNIITAPSIEGPAQPKNVKGCRKNSMTSLEVPAQPKTLKACRRVSLTIATEKSPKRVSFATKDELISPDVLLSPETEESAETSANNKLDILTWSVEPNGISAVHIPVLSIKSFHGRLEVDSAETPLQTQSLDRPKRKPKSVKVTKPLINIPHEHQVQNQFHSIVRKGSLLHKAFGESDHRKPITMAAKNPKASKQNSPSDQPLTLKLNNDDLPLYFHSLPRKAKRVLFDDDEVPLARLSR